jgi:hypothetical protein
MKEPIRCVSLCRLPNTSKKSKVMCILYSLWPGPWPMSTTVTLMQLSENAEALRNVKYIALDKQKVLIYYYCRLMSVEDDVHNTIVIF